MNAVNKSITSVLSNVYIMSLIHVILILYASYYAPNPPQSMKTFFSNTYTKLFFIALLIFIQSKDIVLAVGLAIIFLISINSISGRGPLESFVDDNYGKFSKEFVKTNTATLLEPKTNIVTGCEKITLQDILNTFNGDELKMQKTVKYAFQELMSQIQDETAMQKLTIIAKASGLPSNKYLTDENAPYIASILVQWGYTIGDNCTLHKKRHNLLKTPFK